MRNYERCPEQKNRKISFTIVCLLATDRSKAGFICTICTRVQICTQGANFHPGCIFGHVNGVLRICTLVLICTRVQICSYF